MMGSCNVFLLFVLILQTSIYYNSSFVQADLPRAGTSAWWEAVREWEKSVCTNVAGGGSTCNRYGLHAYCWIPKSGQFGNDPNCAQCVGLCHWDNTKCCYDKVIPGTLPAPPPPPPPPTTCFPSTARVSLENGKSLLMSELHVEDKVKTVSSEGAVTYSEVRVLLHEDPTVTNHYKSITTSLNTTIYLSGSHLIFARKVFTYKFLPIYANDVSIGDEVLRHQNDQMTTVNIIDISSFSMQGAYVPLTEEGNVMVDEVLASCYASFDHNLAHVVMTPLQWFPEVMEMIFGEQNGSPVFVTITKYLGRLAVPFTH